MAPANSGFCYAGGGLESHAEHYGVAVCDTAVHAAGVVCDGRLRPVMTAAAVVPFAFLLPVVTAVMLLAVIVLSVATLMIWVIVMAMVTFLVLSVATFVLRE